MSVKDFNKFREYKRKRSLSGSMSGSKSSSKSPSKSRKSASKSRSRRSRVKSVRTKQNLLNNKAFYAIVIILGLLLLAGIFWLVRWACSKDASSETEENIILGKSKDRCYDSGQVHRRPSRMCTAPHDRYATTSYGRSRQSENLWTRACNWAHRYRSELLFGVVMIPIAWWMYKMCVDDFIPAGELAKLNTANRTQARDITRLTQAYVQCSGDKQQCLDDKAKLQATFEDWYGLQHDELTSLTSNIQRLTSQLKGANGDKAYLNRQLSRAKADLLNTVPKNLLDQCNLSRDQSEANLAALGNHLTAMEAQHAADLAACQNDNQALGTCQAKLAACENNSNTGECNSGLMFGAGFLSGAGAATGNIIPAVASAFIAAVNY